MSAASANLQQAVLDRYVSGLVTTQKSSNSFLQKTLLTCRAYLTLCCFNGLQLAAALRGLLDQPIAIRMS
jgi:hypothetical protein